MQSKLLNPQTLYAIKDLSLIARQVVEGFLAGLHGSLKRGSGMEFSQYRSYQPGDDLRQLDWKMFARSDRYYIRESETDTNLRIQLIIDASNSMNYAEADFSKLTYAKIAAACLGYLASRQGDELALYFLYEDKLELAFSGGANQLSRFYLALEKLTASGKFASAPVSRQLLRNTKNKTISVVISDLYEEETEITDFLLSMRSQKQEVFLMHLLGRQELDLNYTGNILFEDLETGRTLQVNPGENCRHYTELFQEWLEKVGNHFRKNQITYETFWIHEPLDKALRAWLKLRGNR